MSRRQKKLREVVPGLWQVYAYFWPFIRRERRLVAGSLAALAFGVALRILEPWPLKFVLDRVVPTGRPAERTPVPLVDDLDPVSLLTVCSVAVVAVAVLRACADYGSKLGFFLAGNRTVIRVRNDLYRHLQNMSLAFHRRARSGDLMVRVTRDVSLLRDVTATALLPLVASVCVLAGMVTVMLCLQWQLALVALATVPLFWITTLRIGKRIRATARKQRRREGAMATIAAESLSGVAVIKTLGLEDKFAQQFAELNARSQKADLKASRLSTRLGRIVDVLLAVATALVMWYGARLVMAGRLTPGSLLVFLVYLKRAFKPAQEFAKYTARLAKATAAGERVIELLERAPDVRDLPGCTPAPAFRGGVEFRGVCFGYDPRAPVLKQVSFRVRPGRRVALVGPSGTGKSTLLSLIMRLYDPTEGSVLVDGVDIRQYTIRSLRSQISVVLQESVLFAATIQENIACGSNHATQEEIVSAAELADAHRFIEALPDGYETVVGEQGLTLSHGQRQRIAIARAAVRNAPLLILDEPTAGLDEESEQAVAAALTKLAEGRTTFVVTHQLSLAAAADEIVYLDRGLLTERGPHDALMRSDQKYASLFRQQCSPQGDTRRAEAWAAN